MLCFHVRHPVATAALCIVADLVRADGDLVFVRWRTLALADARASGGYIKPAGLGLLHQRHDALGRLQFRKVSRDPIGVCAEQCRPPTDGCDAASRPIPASVELLRPGRLPAGDQSRTRPAPLSSTGLSKEFRTAFAAFLYAPKLAIRSSDVPELYLQFADLYDQEACVYRVGNCSEATTDRVPGPAGAWREGSGCRHWASAR